MNKDRRKELENFVAKHETLKAQLAGWIKQYEGLKAELQSICDDEDFSFQNMGNFQSSLRGMESEEAIDHMNEALFIMDEVTEEIEKIV